MPICQVNIAARLPDSVINSFFLFDIVIGRPVMFQLFPFPCPTLKNASICLI